MPSRTQRDYSPPRLAAPSARPLSALALGAALLLAAAGAQAQDAAPPGFALHAVDPTPAGDRFEVVPEGRVPGLADLHYKLVGDLAQHPLRNATNATEFVDMQAYGHLNVSLTLANFAMLNVDMPLAIYQSGDDGFDRDIGTALGELRTTLRLALMDPIRSSDLALGTQIDVWYPTGDPDNMSGDEKVKARPSVSLSGKSDTFVYALNLGYIFRNHLDLGVSEIGGGPTFGVAAALLLADEQVQIGTEIWGSTVTPVEGSEAPFFDSASTPLQALLGLRLRSGDFAIGLSSGPGLTAAPGSAAFRSMVSISYTADDRVLDRDGDGLRDRADRCPDDPGLTGNGCPPADRDGDTVPDASDACPDDHGLVHVEASKNGCPQAGPAAAPAPAPADR